MRFILLAAAAAMTLSACGKKAADQTNVTTTEATQNASMNANSMDMGNGSMDAANAGNGDAGTNATGGMDANMATNSATENAMMQKDMKTHDKDTNLKNGI